MDKYYRVLGLSPSATDKEIKRAYRTLAFQYHPDRNPGRSDAEARFKEVDEAYKYLIKHPRSIKPTNNAKSKAHVNKESRLEEAEKTYQVIFKEINDIFDSEARRTESYYLRQYEERLSEIKLSGKSELEQAESRGLAQFGYHHYRDANLKDVEYRRSQRLKQARYGYDDEIKRINSQESVI